MPCSPPTVRMKFTAWSVLVFSKTNPGCDFAWLCRGFALGVLKFECWWNTGDSGRTRFSLVSWVRLSIECVRTG